jgi:hypothetical protein
MTRYDKGDTTIYLDEFKALSGLIAASQLPGNMSARF